MISKISKDALMNNSKVGVCEFSVLRIESIPIL